jgi:toxin ParE1/3/4
VAFQVIWSDNAKSELRRIVDNIGADNFVAAERFAGEVIRRVDQLSQFPRSAAVYKRRRGLEIRQLTCRRYRIFYRVQPRLMRVEVMSIRHGARQEPRLGTRKGSGR